MNRNCLKSIIITVSFAVLYNLYLAHWFIHTDSLTTEANIHSLYDPLLSTLKIYKQHGLLFTKHCLNTFYDLSFYPYASIGFPITIYSLGLTNFFISYPWLLNIVLSLVLTCIPLLAFHEKPKKLFFFLILIFSFPLTQIALKGFSIHAWNIILLTLAIFCYDQFNKSKSILFYILFILLSLVSCSIKHLGIIYLLIFLYTQLINAFLKNKTDLILAFSCLFIILISISFYPVEHSIEYVHFIFKQTPKYTINNLIILITALVIFSLVFFKILKLKTPSSKEITVKPTFILTVIFLIISIILVALNFRTYPQTFYLALGVISLLNIAFIYYSLDEYFHWKLLLACTLEASIFLYLFAPFTEFFLLPMFILFYLLSDQLRYKTFLVTFIIFNCIISNCVVVNTPITIKFFFHSYTWHPLNWQKTQMKQIRDSIKNEIQYFLPTTKITTGLISDINFSTKMEFNWNPYYIFTELPNHKESFEDIDSVQSSTLIKKWMDSGEIGIFIEVLDSWDRHINVKSSLKKTITNYQNNVNPNIFNTINRHRIVSQKFKSLLYDSPKYKDQYRSFLLPPKKPIIKLYIHNSLSRYEYNIEQRSIQKLVLLDLLTKSTKDLLKVSSIQQNNLIRAEEHFAKATKLFNSGQKLDCYLELLKANKLNPNHEEIITDLTIIEKSLNEESWDYLRELGISRVKKLKFNQIKHKLDLQNKHLIEAYHLFKAMNYQKCYIELFYACKINPKSKNNMQLLQLVKFQLSKEDWLKLSKLGFKKNSIRL